MFKRSKIMRISEIEKYINELRIDEEQFKQGLTKDNNTVHEARSIISRTLNNVIFIVKSTLDYLRLLIVLLQNKSKSKRIVYTAYNFCNKVDGKYEDRIVKPLFSDNIIFINTSKERYITSISDQKVYNLGGLAKGLSLFFRGKKQMRLYKAYQTINNSIIRSLDTGKEIFLLWFYDLNSLSIIFSKLRGRVKLIEVQHGSIINYPPYMKPAPVKLIDVFYVKNQPTIDYLREHLCMGFDCEYNLIPYPKGKRKTFPGLHVLYASTVDFKGVHPVFLKFLSSTNAPDLHLKVRLHPRERTPEIEELFTRQITSCGVQFTFDKTKNWIAENEIDNLIVVSPWSSSIEDSYDNGYTTIIIDPAGRQRFAHLIDDNKCFYSQDLEETLSKITKGSVS